MPRRRTRRAVREAAGHDVAQASRVVADLVRTGARVGINFPFASSLAVDQLSRWMADGSVGTPQSIEIDVAFAAWPRSWQRDAIACSTAARTAASRAK